MNHKPSDSQCLYRGGMFDTCSSDHETGGPYTGVAGDVSDLHPPQPHQYREPQAGGQVTVSRH